MRCVLVLVRIALILALSGAAPHAVFGAGLYTGQAPVASQSEQDLATGLSAALGQVIVRLTGDAAALARPEVAKALATPNRYVQQYQYQQDVLNEAGQAQVRLTLVAQFDRDGIDHLLRDSGLGASGSAVPTPSETEAAAEKNPGTYRIWVSGVRSAEDYARLIGAITSNERVRDLQTELARGDGVQLRLGIVGPLPRLLEALGTSAGVRVTNAAPPVDGVDALLTMP